MVSATTRLSLRATVRLRHGRHLAITTRVGAITPPNTSGRSPTQHAGASAAGERRQNIELGTSHEDEGCVDPQPVHEHGAQWDDRRQVRMCGDGRR